MTRPRADVEHALSLHRGGLNACQIARAMAIPRPTIREWIVASKSPAVERLTGCFRCDERELTAASDYVYLLGLYLGDGHLSCNYKHVWRLRIFQDARYAGLIDECRLAIGAVS